MACADNDRGTAGSGHMGSGDSSTDDGLRQRLDFGLYALVRADFVASVVGIEVDLRFGKVGCVEGVKTF